MSAFESSGFFVLRTPLLPLSDLATSPDELSERPEVREALFTASPHLFASLDRRLDPSSRKGRRATQALTRYLARICTRATPFGLLAGLSIGEIGERTQLRLGGIDSCRRRTRLDHEYLANLRCALKSDPSVRERLKWRPASSFYRIGGLLRYVRIVEGDDVDKRRYRFVTIDSDPLLEAVLQQMPEGGTSAELLALLTSECEPPVDEAQAAAAIDRWIEQDVLTSSLELQIVGADTLDAFLDVCAEAAPEAAVLLREVRERCAALDAGGLGASPQEYRAIARRLRESPAPVDPSRLFQIDMIRPAEATLSREIVAEASRGVELLHRIAPLREDPLRRFREAFRERYLRRRVRLCEALDEEFGIGIDPDRVGESDLPPLLRELPPREAQPPPSPENAALSERLRSKLAEAEAAAGDVPEIEWTEADSIAAEIADRPPSPDALCARIELVGSEDHGDEDFRIRLRLADGPSGARYFGRFCEVDERLQARVETHLRAEERFEDAVFAEIVTFPEGRMGNVLSRPRLRDAEIVLSGRGAATGEFRIALDDLLISLDADDRFVLESIRLGRRIVPRSTSAHNHALVVYSPFYRFLGHLQNDGLRRARRWSWGSLERRGFLPRVRSGRLILARARWRIDAEELRRIAVLEGEKRVAEIAIWRRRRRLPDCVSWVDGDDEWPIDWTDPLRVDAFLAAAKSLPEVVLEEELPTPTAPSDESQDDARVLGPEGFFRHEIILPMVRRDARRRTPKTSVRRTPTEGPKTSEIRRTFPPGSSWLYVKMYAGPSMLDRLLTETIAPFCKASAGSFERWFFLRFDDPRCHLRVRFEGEPRRLHDEVLPGLQDLAAEHLDAGLIQQVQIDTYEREIERYGGPWGIELAEKVAHRDSEAVVDLLELCGGERDEQARWRWTLRGCAMLLAELVPDESERGVVADGMSRRFAEEFGYDVAVKKRLSNFRRRRGEELEDLLAPSWSADHPLAAGFEILKRRSERLRPVIEELRRRESAGRLTIPIAEIAPSFVHLSVNRLLRSRTREQEAVLYDLLNRLFRTKRLRAELASSTKPRKN